MGVNIRELFSLFEDFVDIIGKQMRDFQDVYEMTENFGELPGQIWWFCDFHMLYKGPKFVLISLLCLDMEPNLSH